MNAYDSRLIVRQAGKPLVRAIEKVNSAAARKPTYSARMLIIASGVNGSVRASEAHDGEREARLVHPRTAKMVFRTASSSRDKEEKSPEHQRSAHIFSTSRLYSVLLP